jgi:hypothetical protein
MARVIFHDPFVDKEPISVKPSPGSSPLPAPGPPAVPASPTLPLQDREREVQELIYDLAVLAAKQDPPVS